MALVERSCPRADAGEAGKHLEPVGCYGFEMLSEENVLGAIERDVGRPAEVLRTELLLRRAPRISYGLRPTRRR